MSSRKILHVLHPNKFTIPFVEFINREFCNKDHLFLFTYKPADETILSFDNVRYLKSRFRRNFVGNTILVLNSFLNSSKIILHGDTILFYFLIFPFTLKRTYWVIYGFELYNNKSITILNRIRLSIKRLVFKNIYAHISHIQGDSVLANEIFGSQAKFFYSPVYLSNIVDNIDVNQRNKYVIKNILVGNSTSPSNCHEEIFKIILPFMNNNIKIYCPLSYGIYENYGNYVIKLGKELFGDNFIAITNLMPIDEYNSLLGTMDIAIFNHKRQEAMGVTLTLLAMGKIVYMNSCTSSFKSLTQRGIKVFDIEWIREKGPILDRNVSENPAIMRRYYSYQVLKESLSVVFNDKKVEE